ncbi:hypothetical protein SK128_028037, partial [Halocaridina rubra]
MTNLPTCLGHVWRVHLVIVPPNMGRPLTCPENIAEEKGGERQRNGKKEEKKEEVEEEKRREERRKMEIER